MDQQSRRRTRSLSLARSTRISPSLSPVSLAGSREGSPAPSIAPETAAVASRTRKRKRTPRVRRTQREVRRELDLRQKQSASHPPQLQPQPQSGEEADIEDSDEGRPRTRLRSVSLGASSTSSESMFGGDMSSASSTTSDTSGGSAAPAPAGPPAAAAIRPPRGAGAAGGTAGAAGGTAGAAGGTAGAYKPPLAGQAFLPLPPLQPHTAMQMHAQPTRAIVLGMPAPGAAKHPPHPRGHSQNNPLMGMANAAELLRTSSPELQPITINAVNALLSVSPKTEPAPSPINGLGALASLASLQDLTPKSKKQAIMRLRERDMTDAGRQMKRTRPRAQRRRAAAAHRYAGGSPVRRGGSRPRHRSRERGASFDYCDCPYTYTGLVCSCNAATGALEPELLPQYAHPDTYNKGGRIGMYTPSQRKALLARWHHKRKNRVWGKVVRYGCRKNLANGRVRIKGRFVKSLPGDAGAAVAVASIS